MQRGRVVVALFVLGSVPAAAGALLSCGGSFVEVSGSGAEGGADDGTIPGDASKPDGNAPGCPASAPQGACSGQLTCTYGCTFCSCSDGVWACAAPGCYGGCPTNAPAEGTACGGCCGPSVGMTCDYACPAGAGRFKATCTGTGSGGVWDVAPCAGSARTVSCGATECALDAGQACCDTIREDASTHACGSLASGSFCFGGALQECDEKADCPSGNVCCLQFLTQGISATCMPTCITGAERYQACATTAECENGGPCQSHGCASGERVQTCEKPRQCL
jgi:hypothetical protein